MKIVLKFILFLALVSGNMLQAKLNWMPSNYWLSGMMHISSVNLDIIYTMYVWDAKTKSYDSKGIPLPVNKTLNIGDLLGGISEAPLLSDGAKVIFAPTLPFISTGASDEKTKADQQTADVLSGKIAPFFVVTRVGGIINFYIIGPTSVLQRASQKIFFNIYDFEKKWVVSSHWYKTLINHAVGMALGCSFDATLGEFLNTTKKGQFIYLYGLKSKSSALGPNWFGSEGPTLQMIVPGEWIDPKTNQIYPKDISPAIHGLTIDALIKDGIIVKERGLSIPEFKQITDMINESKSGNFKY